MPSRAVDAAAGDHERVRAARTLERAERMTTFTLFGGGVIDLRYADFTSPDVEIHAYSIMGGQTILVPPEVNVDDRGVGVMGAFDHTSTSRAHPAHRTSPSAASRCGAASASSARSDGRSPPKSTQPWIELFWTKASGSPVALRGRTPEGPISKSGGLFRVPPDLDKNSVRSAAAGCAVGIAQRRRRAPAAGGPPFRPSFLSMSPYPRISLSGLFLPPPLPKRTKGCGAKLAEYDPFLLAVGVWLPSCVFSTTGGSCARFAASGAAPPPRE